MSTPKPKVDPDDEHAETAALQAAVDKARRDQRGIGHDEMRQWLLKVAEGDVNADPPADHPV